MRRRGKNEVERDALEAPIRRRVTEYEPSARRTQGQSKEEAVRQRSMAAKELEIALTERPPDGVDIGEHRAKHARNPIPPCCGGWREWRANHACGQGMSYG